jgi:hypothetical protein
MDSEIKTDVEVLKKQIFGNGVKGALTRIEDLEDKLDTMEIYMEKSFNEKIQMVLEKIEERRKFNWGQALVIIGLVANIAVGLNS